MLSLRVCVHTFNGMCGVLARLVRLSECLHPHGGLRSRRQVLGEAALLTGRPRNATVVVAGAAVRCIEITLETFDQATERQGKERWIEGGPKGKGRSRR